MGTSIEYSLFCPHCRRHYESERTVCPRDGGRLLEVPLTLPRPGNVFDSRYVILETIGKGGMATIYGGYDILNRRRCALKVLKVKFSSEERAVAQFFTEARMARRLEHPHIVRTYDYGRTENGYLYIGMELLQGQTLSRIIRMSGALEVDRALNVISQIFDALDAAHAEGTIHRDLKPENIFVSRSEDGESVKLLDFGIAQFAGTTATNSRDICGTPAYMSPEQIRGREAVPASDLYSAGIVLFEMLTGHQPFTGPSAMEILKRQLKMAPPRLSDLYEDSPFSEELEALVFRLMRKRVKNRFTSAAQVLAELTLLSRPMAPNSDLPAMPDRTDEPEQSTVRIPVFSYNCHPVESRDTVPAFGIVPISSSRTEELLENLVRPGIMLEEELSIRFDGEPVVEQDGVEGDSRQEDTGVSTESSACMVERYTLLHARFVAMDSAEPNDGRAEELRMELAEDLDPWFTYIEQLGGLVCYDSGSDLKVLFGYLTDAGEYATAALEAAKSLSLQVEYQAIRQGKPCGVRVGVATGVVYTDHNVEGPLDWLIRGSDIDFAVRLSRIAPLGGIVMCQNTALHAQPAASVYDLARISSRGGKSVQTFLLKNLVAGAPAGDSSSDEFAHPLVRADTDQAGPSAIAQAPKPPPFAPSRHSTERRRTTPVEPPLPI